MPFVEVQAKFRLAVWRQGRIAGLDLVDVLLGRDEMEGGIALAQSEPVHLAAVRRECELVEFEQRELPDARRGKGVFKLYFGETVLGCRELEPFLDRSVHGGSGPVGQVRSLCSYGAFGKAQPDDAGVRIRLFLLLLLGRDGTEPGSEWRRHQGDPQAH